MCADLPIVHRLEGAHIVRALAKLEVLRSQTYKLGECSTNCLISVTQYNSYRVRKVQYTHVL